MSAGHLVLKTEIKEEEVNIDDTDNDFAYQQFYYQDLSVNNTESVKFERHENDVPENAEEEVRNVNTKKTNISCLTADGIFDSSNVVGADTFSASEKLLCIYIDKLLSLAVTGTRNDWKSILKSYNPVVLLERIVTPKKTQKIQEVVIESEEENFEIDVENGADSEIRTNLLTEYLDTLLIEDDFAYQEAAQLIDQNSSEIKSYTCEICLARYFHQRTLTVHMKTHPITQDPLNQEMEEPLNKTDAPYVCWICFAPFFAKGNLSKHMHQHNVEKPIACELCPSKFWYQNNLDRHMKIHTRKNLMCDICEMQFTQKNQLKSHMKTHQPKQAFMAFVCELCSAEFINQSRLTRHLLSHSEERPYACDDCPLRFLQKYHLAEHRRIHTDERPFKCDFCPKAFRQAGTRIQHMKTHLKNKGFQCEICLTTLSCRKSLSRHLKLHTPEERNWKIISSPEKKQESFKCNYCSTAFLAQRSLDNHVKVHNKDKACGVCNLRFRERDLGEHMKSHLAGEGQIGYECHDCSEKFKMAAQLQKHVCSEKSKMATQLKKHVPTQVERKPFSCNVCYLKFRSLSHLKNHGKCHKTAKIRPVDKFVLKSKLF